MAVLILLLAAAACFLLAAFGVAPADFHLIPLGLMLWVVAEAVDTWLDRRTIRN